jgi:hypothetical protein
MGKSGFEVRGGFQLLLQDLRYAVRMLRKAPGFTFVAVTTLALGIGANTAIFTLLNQVLLQTLPVKNPGQLVMLDAPGPNSGRVRGPNAFSYPMYRDIRDHNSVFSGVLGRWGFDASLTHGNATERVKGELVTGNAFDVLGVRPLLGRAFTSDDDVKEGAHPLVILSYTCWQRRFGSDGSIIGQTVDVNSMPLTVIGVAPAGFFGLEVGNATDIFVPMMMMAAMTPGFNGMEDRRDLWLNVFARLNPGSLPEQAEAGVNVLFHQILEGEAQPADRECFSRTISQQTSLLAGWISGAVVIARAFLDAPSGIDGTCSHRAADRLRQHCQLADDKSRRPAERDGDPACARRRPRPHSEAAPGRKHSAGVHWRRPRDCPGTLVGIRAVEHDSGRPSLVDFLCRSQSEGPGFCVCSVDRHRPVLWTDSGASGDAAAGGPNIEVRSNQRCGRPFSRAAA